MGHIVLLAVCVFFIFLTPGDAVKCRQCTTLSRKDPCVPRDKCEINPATETCVKMTVYYNKRVEYKILTCKKKEFAECGKAFNKGKNGLSYEYSCCSNKNYCNQ